MCTDIKSLSSLLLQSAGVGQGTDCRVWHSYEPHLTERDLLWHGERCWTGAVKPPLFPNVTKAMIEDQEFDTWQWNFNMHLVVLQRTCCWFCIKPEYLYRLGSVTNYKQRWSDPLQDIYTLFCDCLMFLALTVLFCKDKKKEKQAICASTSWSKSVL